MEFPTIGAHCATPSCQSLSFLPFQCPFCTCTFCSTHRLPAAHACPVWESEAAANSVHLCPRCDRLLLAPKGSDPDIIIKEHVDRACSLHLLPSVQSIAVPCAHSGCTRKDRVVAKCDHPPGGCDKVFCLKHRQPNDHNCAKLIERALTIKEAKTDLDMKKEVIANTFSKDSTLSSSAAALTTGNKPGIMTPEEKAAIAKAKAEQARAAIAEAKAKVAARAASSSTTTPPLCSKGGAIDPGPGGSRAGTIGSTSPQPKVKKASRVVSLIKLRKVAQGEDKIPTNARVHVYIRSPIFPQLDDKAVFVDKSWTVGRCLDKIVECLKIAVPKNEPFDAQKRLSIFHAKELEDVPALLSMQDRVQTIAKIESGDLFYLALANHSWDTNVTS